MDENDYVTNPQTGERLLIPQVCRECGSDDLAPYTPQGDFLPIDGWRICRECAAYPWRNAVNAPIPEQWVCPSCGGAGGHLIYAASDGAASPDCKTCGGKGIVYK